MKYKIDKIRERSHVENGVTVQIMRIFFSVSELQYSMRTKREKGLESM